MFKTFEEAFGSRKLRVNYIDKNEKSGSLTLSDVDEKYVQNQVNIVVTGIADLMRDPVQHYHMISTAVATEIPAPKGVVEDN